MDRAAAPEEAQFLEIASAISDGGFAPKPRQRFVRVDKTTLSQSTAWSALRRSLEGFAARRVGPGDIDDVVQEILLAIAAPGGLPRTGPYIHGVARRVVADHHRKRAREHHRLARLAEEPEDPAEEPLTPAEADIVRALSRFLPQVSALHREALRAVDLEGRTQAEVARQLGLPLSTLRTRVQRGRAELRSLLRDCCEIDLDVRGRVVSCTPRTPSDCCS